MEVVPVYQIQNAPMHQGKMYRMHQTSKGHVNSVVFSLEWNGIQLFSDRLPATPRSKEILDPGAGSA